MKNVHDSWVLIFIIILHFERLLESVLWHDYTFIFSLYVERCTYIVLATIIMIVRINANEYLLVQPQTPLLFSAVLHILIVKFIDSCL